MSKLIEKIEREAVTAMRFHSFAREWKAAIVAAWVLKFFTGLVSIYAGAGYLAGLLVGAVGNVYAGWLAAMVLLFLLETINATALFKGFKFVFRKRIGAALAALFVALFSFSVSFYVSVEGIAAMQSAKVDKAESITGEFSDGLKTQLSDVEAQILMETKAAETIERNPQGWQGGKREVLTTAQLAELSQIRAKIADLRASKQNLRVEATNATKVAVSENKAVAQSEGAKYYRIVSILMFIQLFANFALTFFYSRIFLEHESTQAQRDDLEHFAQGLFAQMFTDIKERYATLQGQFASASRNVFSDVAQRGIGSLQPVSGVLTPSAQTATNTPVNTPANTPLTPPNTQRTGGIGFGAQRTQGQPIAQAQPTTQPTTQQATQAETTEGATYYKKMRPELCQAIEQQAANEVQTTNRELARVHGCSEATVRNCRRAILESGNL
jgi:hypothetical protein